MVPLGDYVRRRNCGRVARQLGTTHHLPGNLDFNMYRQTARGRRDRGREVLESAGCQRVDVNATSVQPYQLYDSWVHRRGHRSTPPDTKTSPIQNTEVWLSSFLPFFRIR